MTTYTVFKTPELIDLNAIKTFGINSKPNTVSPIGFFGTGLKYAIAVICRNKLDMVLKRGSHTYYFNVEEGVQFRDRELNFISMNRQKGIFNKQTVLPFTDALGKTWDLWQAFRELYSNTLDEKGVVEITNEIPNTDHKFQTIIAVADDLFAREYMDREKTFLPDALMNLQDGKVSVQAFDRPSQHVYYRGIRVMDLKKSSRFTYNIITPIELTEDRTAKYEWQVQQAIAQFIATHKDPEFIKKAMISAKESFEDGIDFGLQWSSPSAEFLNVMAEMLGGGKSINFSAEKYYRSYRPAPITAPYPIHGVLSARLQWWLKNSDELHKMQDLYNLLEEVVLFVASMEEKGENTTTDTPF